MPKKTRQVILASQSPQRRKMLQTLNLKFEVVPAHIDEGAVTAPNQIARARKISHAKALAVAKKFPDAIILAGDTFAIKDGQPLEKPKTKQKAKRMLKSLSGSSFLACTGACYLDAPNGISKSTVIKTKVIFRDLSDSEIDHYVKNQPVTTWSAGFSPAYDEGAALIKEVKGPYTGFSHGLPLEFFVPLLRKSGVLK